MAIREYVVDNETAIIVPQKDVMALKSAISRLMNDEVLQRSIAQKAKKRSRSWTREQYFQRISDIIVDNFDQNISKVENRRHIS
jgi:glycosyltransferase involved in cell wall biosynthesis